MQQKIIVLLAALVVAFMFAGAASAASPVTANQVSATVPTGDQSAPQVSASGPRIVWVQQDATTLLNNVWVKNTATGNTAVVNAMPTNQAAPDISGTYVVWQQMNTATGFQNIFVRNIATNGFGALDPRHHTQANARLGFNQSATIAVWQQEIGGIGSDNKIFTKKVGAAGVQGDLIHWTAGDQITPDVDRNTVVWADDSGNGWYNTFFYDLESNTHAFVNPFAADQLNPKISGHNIVYVMDNGVDDMVYLSNTDVFMLIGANGKAISIPGYDSAFADISGNRVAWSQTTSALGNVGVRVYNIVTGNSGLVSSMLVPQVQSAIAGDIVVWTQIMPLFDQVYWRNVATGQHAKLT